jgi:hypothetical protein
MAFDLRNIVNAVTSGLGSIAEAPPGEAQRMWQETQGFAMRVLGAATEKWLPFYGQGLPCWVQPLRAGVPFPCGGKAVLACDVCGNPACIHHVQVDQSGNGTCFACIAELVNMRQRAAGGAPPPHAGPNAHDARQEAQRQAVKDAFKELGLREGATWEEIAQAHRKLAAKYHPDRVRTPAAKKKAAEKSVRVNSAFATLKTNAEKAA